MTSVANLQPEPAPILACTISRDVQNFELLIDDMEIELGESWGDLSFDDAQVFLDQPEAKSLEFVAIAVNAGDEADLQRVTDIIKQAKSHGIKVVLIADQVSPVALHQLLRLGADDFVPYPLPEGALHEAIDKIRRPAAHLSVAASAAHPHASEDAEVDAPHPGFKAKGDRDGVLLPASQAAFMNAFQAHALEFDAIHEAAVVHAMTTMSTMTAPVLFATHAHGHASVGSQTVKHLLLLRVERRVQAAGCFDHACHVGVVFAFAGHHLVQTLRRAQLSPGLAVWWCGMLGTLLRLHGEPPMTRFLAEQLSTPHWYDISAAARDFGYVPRVSTAQGLVHLAEWWRSTHGRV